LVLELAVGNKSVNSVCLFPSQEAKLLVAMAYRHTEKVLLDNLDKLQAVRASRALGPIEHLRCVQVWKRTANPIPPAQMGSDVSPSFYHEHAISVSSKWIMLNPCEHVVHSFRFTERLQF
jgi:hypothetical protein